MFFMLYYFFNFKSCFFFFLIEWYTLAAAPVVGWWMFQNMVLVQSQLITADGNRLEEYIQVKTLEKHWTNRNSVSAVDWLKGHALCSGFWGYGISHNQPRIVQNQWCQSNSDCCSLIWLTGSELSSKRLQWHKHGCTLMFFIFLHKMRFFEIFWDILFFFEIFEIFWAFWSSLFAIQHLEIFWNILRFFEIFEIFWDILIFFDFFDFLKISEIFWFFLRYFELVYVFSMLFGSLYWPSCACPCHQFQPSLL